MTGTEPHSFLYMLPMAAFMLQGRVEVLHLSYMGHKA